MMGEQLSEELEMKQKGMHGMKIYHLARISARIGLTPSSMGAIPLRP